MHKLIEYICDELNELDRKAGKDGKLSMAEIEYADKLSHIKKSLLAADELWENSEYSEAGGGNGQTRMGGGGNSYRRGGVNPRRMDGGGGSYARGRGRNARRDSMGRYSNEGGYSGAEEDFRMELEELIEDAPNEHIKQKMRELMREM
jgi:hypothetical protein